MYLNEAKVGTKIRCDYYCVFTQKHYKQCGVIIGVNRNNTATVACFDEDTYDSYKKEVRWHLQEVSIARDFGAKEWKVEDWTKDFPMTA